MVCMHFCMEGQVGTLCKYASGGNKSSSANAPQELPMFPFDIGPAVGLECTSKLGMVHIRLWACPCLRLPDAEIMSTQS